MPQERLLVAVELLRAVAVGAVLAGLLAGAMPVVYVAIAVSGLLGAISAVAVSLRRRLARRRPLRGV